MVSRAFVLALALLAPFATHASRDAANGTSAAASAAVRMAIEIPRILQMRVLDQPRELVIRAEDVARGYVTARARLDILSTHRRGYQVMAALAAGPVVEAEVNGLAQPLRVGTDENAQVAMPSMVGKPRPEPYDVEFRLRLAPDAAAGAYTWPVRMAIGEP